MPKVSVLIPTYNRENLLRSALESLIIQTTQDFEVVIIDNASEDGTQDCINYFTGKLPNLRCYRQPAHVTLLENFNTCVQFAEGEYIKFLLDDDILEPGCIETMSAYLDQYPDVSLITSKRTLIDENGLSLPDSLATLSPVTSDTMFSGHEIIDSVLTRRINFIGEPTTTMFRKSLMRSPWGYFAGKPFRTNADLAVWFNLLMNGKFIYLTKPLSCFRQHSGQDQKQRSIFLQGSIEWFQLVRETRKLGGLQEKSSYREALDINIDSGEKIVKSLTQAEENFRESFLGELEWAKKERAAIIKLLIKEKVVASWQSNDPRCKESLSSTILLIYPGLVEGFNSYNNGSDWFNHGVGLISSILKEQGYTVAYLDCRKLKDWDEFSEIIQGIDFQIALISVATVDFDASKQIGQIIKQKNPGIVTIVGGPHPTLMTDSTAEVKEFDYIFTHEAELTLPGIIKELLQFKTLRDFQGQETNLRIPRVIKGEMPVNLDLLPYVDRNLAPKGETPWFSGFEKPYYTITASRGCLFNCAFCQPAEREIFGNKVRKRTVNNILDELEYLQNNFGMKSFMLHDDSFTQYYSWVEEFCEKKIQRGLNQPFACQSRASVICKRPDLLKKLADAGLKWVLIGFESGSDRVLDFIKKETSVRENIEAARLCRQFGIKIFANYMFGLPTETNEEMKQTALMIQSIKPDHYSPSIFTPAPGSELYEYCIKNDLTLINSSEGFRRDIGSGAKIKGVDYNYVLEMVKLSQRKNMAFNEINQKNESNKINLSAKFIYITSGALEPFLEIDISLIQTFERMGLNFKVFNLRSDLGDIEKLKKLINTFQPDFIFTIFGQLLPRKILKTIKTTSLLTLLWTLDDPHNFQLARTYAPLYDVVFTNDASCLSLYKYLGVKNVHLLPGGVDIYRYRRDEITGLYDKQDILIVGSPFEKRVKFMRHIIKEFSNCHKIMLVGPGWKQKLAMDLNENVTVVEGWFTPEEIVNFYKSAKIVLNIHRPQDDNYLNLNPWQVPVWEPNPRTYEIAACKVFQLVDSLDNLNKRFEVGKEIYSFNQLDDLVSKIRYYLAQDQRRQEIAELSCDRVYREHTYEHRVKTIFSVINSILYADLKEQPDQEERTTVSIIIPLYNNAPLTQQCIESILHSDTGIAYEIIVIDNGSTDQTMNLLSKLDCTIVSNSSNLGFAKACNQGAIKAKGDYLLFLNNDTVVTGNWLEKMLEPFSSNKLTGLVGCKLLYPNDTVQHAGVGFTYVHGFFEPVHVYREYDKNATEINVLKEMQAVTGACLLISRNLFFDVGMMDEGYRNGLEDIDLCLKVWAKGHQVIYQPEAQVYHLESKTPGRFNYVRENINYFTDKWARTGLIKLDTGISNGIYTWLEKATSTPKAKSSIIILTLNNLDYTKLCIESIVKNSLGEYELIIVDNGSTDGTIEYVQKLQGQMTNLKLVRNSRNEGYAYACNQGVALAAGEYILFLNNDVIVPANWLAPILETFSLSESIGIVGPRSNNCAGAQKVDDVNYTLESFEDFADMWHIENSQKFSEADSVIGFCMAVRKSVIDVIGGFDTEFGTGNFEDTDFCLRARLLGYKILIRHDIFIHHFGSKTFLNEKINYNKLMEKNHKIYKGKWDTLKNFSNDDEKLASLFVPVKFSDIYNNRINPFAIEGLTGTSILAVPDWDNQASWYELIFRYLGLRQNNPDCCLILRVDPPTEPELNNAVKCLEIFMQDMSLEDIPGLIVEATQLIPIRRGSLYTAVDFFVDLPQQRSFHYRRAAEASGCRVVDLDRMEQIFARIS